jgi:DNA helicase IV
VHPELASEQAYVDHAYACLEEMRRQVERAGEAAIGETEALVLEAWAAKRLITFEDAERGLCFGRLDLDGVIRPLYVGRRWVHEEQTPIVVNWQAPAARAFYTATVAEPQGVALRRRFRTDGRRLLDLYDEPLDGSAGDVVHGVADILLEELERSRDEHMRDIVATIQADQYRLITREPEGVLVIQGGPGTGKTAVGLHRASWLLYTYRRELERSGVLVVGPNPVFMDYVSHVLPMLGEERVEQRAVNELVNGIEAVRLEPEEVVRLKADARMARVIAAAVRKLPQLPDELLAIRLEGVELRLAPEEVAGLIGDAQAESTDHAAGRERLRMKIVRAFYERYTARLGNAAYHSFDDIESTLRSGGFLTRTLNALWPRPKAEQLVRRLLTNDEQLAAAADGVLDGNEQRLLLSHRGRGWSDADLALLDEARALLDGAEPARGHLIVDEAQDLTPMQLRMLARRSSGAVTILGDIAQSSGPVAYTGWDELVRLLAPDVSPTVEELRLAYRVPAEVMELALPLLPLIAPAVTPPIAYRSGDEPPRLVRAEPGRVVATAVREAGLEALRDGRTGLIAPDEILAEIEPLLPHPETAFDELSSPIQALTPRAAKGLEFDRVVLVEPGVIARGGLEGLRALYVALTRATKTLVVVHAEPLPAELRPGWKEGTGFSLSPGLTPAPPEGTGQAEA